MSTPRIAWSYSQNTVSTQVKEDELSNMSASSKDWAQMKTLWGNYLSSATIHGLPHARETNIYPFRRNIWIVLVIVMATAMGYTLYTNTIQLQQYPIKTSVLKSYDERPFPAITICNYNQYHHDRVPDNPMVYDLPNRCLCGEIVNTRAYTLATQIRAYMVLSSEVYSMARYWNPSFDRVEFQNLPDVSGDELLNVTRHAAHRLEDMFLLCKWRSRNYPCKDLLEPSLTFQGLCYSFNFNTNKSKLQIAPAAGINDGLRLIVNVELDKYFYSSSVGSGVRVIVNHDAPLFPKDEGWPIRPGASAVISLKKNGRKNLPSPYKAFGNTFCTDTESPQFVNPAKRFRLFRYRTINCLNNCLFSYLTNTCGCYYFNDVAWFDDYFPHSIPLCSAKELLTCYWPALGKIDGSFRDTCDCPTECRTMKYGKSISYANSFSEFASAMLTFKNVSKSPEYFSRNVIDITVYLTDMAMFDIVQEPETTVSDVLGTIGGQMGLFLGASLLSLVELIEIIILLVLRSLRAGVNLTGPGDFQNKT